MNKITLTIILLFGFVFGFSQSNNFKESILFEPITNFNLSNFNADFKTTLNSSILSVYNFNDVVSNDFKISIKNFQKPISKYAFENFREVALYKSILPKINFIDFQRGMR